MKGKGSVIQHIAPTLASALNGPFVGVANKFVIDNLLEKGGDENKKCEEIIEDLLRDTGDLQKIKEVEKDFKEEMNLLKIDVFALEQNQAIKDKAFSRASNKPHIIISILFLSVYFLMLVALFVVETSDTLNMQQGENSLMDEIQIFFGVLTAGVGQVLSFWFGGFFNKSA